MSWIYLFICLFIHCKCCGSRESYCINGTFFCKVKLAFFDVPVSRNNWNAFFFNLCTYVFFLFISWLWLILATFVSLCYQYCHFCCGLCNCGEGDWIVLEMVLNSLWFYSNSITFLRCLFIFLTIRNFVSLFGNGKKWLLFFLQFSFDDETG